MFVNYICANCKKENEFKFEEEYTLTNNQELFEKIEDDSLFTHKCERCGEYNIVHFPALFIDDNYKFLIKLDNEDIKNKVLLRTPEYQNYKLRMVNDINELKEKLRIFYSFLDDVVVEIIKHILSEHLKEEKIDFDLIVFHRLINKNKLSFVILNKDAVSNITYDIEGYNKIYYKLLKLDSFKLIQQVNEENIIQFLTYLDK